MLFSGRIPQIASVQVLAPVRVPNASDATYVKADKRIWVRKAEAMLCPNGMQAEALYWLMARELDLPVPDAAVHCERGNIGWLSLRVDPVRHWDPGEAALAINLGDLGGVLALDAVLGEHDRHEGNLLLQTIDGANRKLWAIDAGNAAVGTLADFEALADAPPRPHAALRVPVDLLAGQAAAFAANIAAIPGVDLASFVDEACAVAGTTDLAARVTTALVRRCALAKPIVTRYLSKIPRPT